MKTYRFTLREEDYIHCADPETDLCKGCHAQAMEEAARLPGEEPKA